MDGDGSGGPTFASQTPGFAGRGLASKAAEAEIRAALKQGETTMPLWDISLDREIALGCGPPVSAGLERLLR